MVPAGRGFRGGRRPLTPCVFTCRAAPPERAMCGIGGFENAGRGTPEQDPAFAFRIIVDIASKGLSPGINDPTTAVLAIDEIHHLLRSVGSRHLAGRSACRCRGPASTHLPHARLGRLCPPGGHRNPSLRRRKHSGQRPVAGHAGKPDPELAEERLRSFVGNWPCFHRSAERFFRSRRIVRLRISAISKVWAVNMGRVRAGWTRAKCEFGAGVQWVKSNP